MMKTIFAAVAKTIASLVCLFILLNVIALSIPAAPLDVSLYTDKDVTPLPDYAEYKTISTGEKSFIKYIDAKNPELKDPPVMLFLHGFPESALLTWHSQIAYFAKKGYHVIAPDQRGYNGSYSPGLPTEYIISTHIRNDAVTLLKHVLGSQPSAYVVGHDWGGMVAWNIASHHPELVTKLIILNCPHPAIFLEHMKDPRSWYMFFMTLPVIPEKSILKGDGVDVFKGCDFDKFGEQGIMGKPIFARYTQLWTTYPTGMLNWYRQIVPELIWGSPKRLAKVTVPTLVLWGRDDKFAHESVAKRSVDQYTTQGRVEYLDNVNHWVTHMVPDVVNNRIEAFVNEK